jgi:hypothetical protein
MKKVYMTPEILLHKVELQYLMTASDGTPTIHEEEADPDEEVLSRRGNSQWDEEEEW